MAEVPSTLMLQIGEQAPSFQLPDAQGNVVHWQDIQGSTGTLVVFACNHCPFVIHLAKQLGLVSELIASYGINTVAINANDIVQYPQDDPQNMPAFANQYNWQFPYLFDGNQKVAKAYKAACTPDFFLFDKLGNLAYAGQFDDSRPKNNLPITGADLLLACQQLVNQQQVTVANKPATGCNIKWIKGNEPVYFN